MAPVAILFGIIAIAIRKISWIIDNIIVRGADCCLGLAAIYALPLRKRMSCARLVRPPARGLFIAMHYPFGLNRACSVLVCIGIFMADGAAYFFRCQKTLVVQSWEKVITMSKQSTRASIGSYQNRFPVIDSSVFIADGARIIGDVRLHKNCSIWFNAVLRGDAAEIEVGEGTNIQDNAVVHGTQGTAPVRIGNHVTVGHLAIVHGCTVEDWSLIGMGATILDGAVIGRESLVGAGSLVTQGTVVPPRSLVFGRPAKVVRALSDEEVASLHESAAHYLDYMAGYNFD